MLSRIKSKTSVAMSGFSLVELMVAVVLIGVLASVALPSFREWTQNTKTRSVAEALQNGIKLAQTEAVRRGRRVQFFLTDAVPAANASVSAGGRNWGIQSMTLADANVVEQFIQGATLKGDSGSVVMLSSDAVITFNSIGRVIIPPTPITYQLSNPDGTRRLNVTVSKSGGIRMCDPEKLRSSSPDGCS